MTSPPGLGHLRELSIDGLFDNRNFAFELDRKEPTILTGSNGSGKSTVLRIINAIGTGAWTGLIRQPFRSASLTFEHGTSFTVSKTDDQLTAVLNDTPYTLDLADVITGDWEYEDIARIIPDLHKVRGAPAHYFELGGSVLTRDEVTERLRRRGFLNLTEEYEPLVTFTNDFNLLYITDQRLVVSEERLAAQRHGTTRTESRRAADLSARELARQMQDALSNYASESQRLDRDFPHRVVQAMARANQEEVPLPRLQDLLRDVEADREELQRVGLLPRDLTADAFQDLPLSEPHVRPVIETFISDTKRKFDTLADLRDRLTLFAEFLNQHYENKRVITTPRGGFRVEIDGDPEKLISPSQLSSGEQQMLVLAYEVLFRSEPRTLVLIDEPELSLHVVWQDTFIDDLSRMGSVRDLQFLLATHSPSLIGGREDLRRSLDSIRM